jgi:hypothetical protein
VADTTTEGAEETYEVDEQGIAYSSESAPSDEAQARPATIAPASATGRRKEAVARVRLVPGTGQWTVNGRALDSYFPNKLHQQVVNEPFVTTDLVGRCAASGCRPGAQRGRCRRQPSVAEEGGSADPRRAGDRAQEGRPEEGPQGAPVQQALTRTTH